MQLAPEVAASLGLAADNVNSALAAALAAVSGGVGAADNEGIESDNELLLQFRHECRYVATALTTTFALFQGLRI